jgi:hypothetical protein
LAIEVDESRWPMLIIRWPSGSVTDADVEDFLTRSATHLTRGQRYASLHDGVRASGLDGKQRQRMSEYTDEHREALSRWMVAAAIVSPSAVVRGVVTAINWLSPPPFPQRQFAMRSEAEAWIQGMLSADRTASFLDR